MNDKKKPDHTNLATKSPTEMRELILQDMETQADTFEALKKKNALKRARGLRRRLHDPV